MNSTVFQLQNKVQWNHCDGIIFSVSSVVHWHLMWGTCSLCNNHHISFFWTSFQHVLRCFDSLNTWSVCQHPHSLSHLLCCQTVCRSVMFVVLCWTYIVLNITHTWHLQFAVCMYFAFYCIIISLVLCTAAWCTKQKSLCPYFFFCPTLFSGLSIINFPFWMNNYRALWSARFASYG